MVARLCFEEKIAWILECFCVWTGGCARVRVCKGDWKFLGRWRLVRKDWNLWIVWFCSEKKFGTLSLVLVGIQRSLNGQFCLLAGDSKLSCFVVDKYIGSNAAGNPIVV